MRHSTVTLIATGFALLTAACANDANTGKPESPVIAARQQLLADLSQCTTTYGYDPKAVTGIPENQLAPHELQWRQCGYDAANRYVRAVPAMNDKYQQLINEDITMTNAIQAGTMTRSQRRQRIEELIAQIKTAEESLIQASAEEQDRQTEQVRQVVDQIRGYHF